jgi:hypothetical protein
VSLSSTTSGQTEYVYWVAPTCPANTAETAYTTTSVAISTCMLWRAEVRIPPGHAGLTGIALMDSGAFIVPYNEVGPAWLVGDDDDLAYNYDKQLGDNVVLATYNTDDTYTHGWQVRLIYTPLSAVNVDEGVIITPASADWLDEAGADG